MSCELTKKTCQPCRGGVPALKGSQLDPYYNQLKGWRIIDEHHLQKEYAFSDFKDALAFANQIGALAEQEDHHPDILLSYGKIKIDIWTHKVDGLTESDFILAAKIDDL